MRTPRADVLYHAVLKRLIAGEKVSDVVGKNRKNSAVQSYNAFRRAKMDTAKTRSINPKDMISSGVVVLCSGCLSLVQETRCVEDTKTQAMICPDCLPTYGEDTRPLKRPTGYGLHPQPYMHPDVDALRPGGKGTYNKAPSCLSGKASTYKSEWFTGTGTGAVWDDDTDLDARIATYKNTTSGSQMILPNIAQLSPKEPSDDVFDATTGIIIKEDDDPLDAFLHFHVEKIDSSGNSMRRMGTFPYQDDAFAYADEREMELKEDLLSVFECRKPDCNIMWEVPFGEGKYGPNRRVRIRS